MSSAISLSNKVLSWEPSRQSSSMADDPDWKIPYRYWKHAEALLTHPDDDHFRIDCIGNLKRAIDHRLKRLNSLYRFKKIPDPLKPAELLDALSYFGIARPTMLREVSEVRNLLEHHYKSPPPQRRCQELVEFSWYFLRSTDSLSVSVLNDFVLQCSSDVSEEDDWVEVTYGPDTNWKCAVRGRVPAAYLSRSADLGIAVELKRLETAEELTRRAAKERLATYARRNTGIYFAGEILGNSTVFAALTSMYFAVL